MKKLYFIRHGESEMNVAGLISGITDTPLTKLGRQQARKAGQTAKHLGIDCIVSSPLLRAYETAKIFAEQIGFPAENIRTNELLAERNHGSLEGKPYAPGMDWDSYPDVETDAALVARAERALDWINGLKADHILVASHGGTGRALRSILRSDYPMTHREQIKNAELVCWVEENE